MEPPFGEPGEPERLEERLRLPQQLLRDKRADPDHLVAVVRVGDHVRVVHEPVEHGEAIRSERPDPPVGAFR